MISYERRCIFVHIPKTGGTSIENAIWGSDRSVRSPEQLWMGAVRPGFNKYQSGGLQHLLAWQIRLEVGAEVFHDCFKFAFVRNPWSKAVSQFRYVRTRKDLLEFMGMTRRTSFGRYLKLIERTEHVQSFEQCRFVLDDDGTELVDFIGRFERLEHDFRIVADRIGLPNATLPHDMRSDDDRPWRSYYDRRTRARVARIYARDIERFGYDFED